MTSREDRWVDAIVLVVSSIILVLVLYPLIYIVSASFSDPKLVMSGDVFLLPKQASFEGYRQIFEYKPIWIGYRNTLFYTAAGTLLNLLFTIPCAYALSRRDFAGRNALMFLFVFTMFFSGGLIPTYLVVQQLGLINTVWVLLIPKAVNVWNLIIARTFFQTTIPNELKDAAFIDGCSNFKLFVKIIIPLSAPIIVVMTLFYAVYHWNAFFDALIYLSEFRLYPLQLILRNILIMDQLVDMMGADSDALEQIIRRLELREAMKYGIVVVSSLPVLVLYPFLQKYFVKGVMIGSIKG